MKRIFTLFALTLLLATSAFSQNSKVDYDRDSRWFLGFNLGGTWMTQQETDWRLGPGGGFVLGRSFGVAPRSPFSIDIRGRFLAAKFKGQSTDQYTLDSTSTSSLVNYGGSPLYGSTLNGYRDSIGYFIPNFETQLYSGSLELVLNLHGLERKTGWNLYFFGGIGIKGYRTTSNLFDGDSLSTNIYDYGTFGGTSTSNLLNNQDDIYETKIVGDVGDMKINWMPSVGVGLSYKVNPWFTIGLEHKMTWVRDNDFDAMPFAYDGTATKNDIYHLSGVTMKFNFLRGEPEVLDTTQIVEVDTTTNIVPNNVVDAPAQPPIVDIYDPAVSPYTVTNEIFNLQANVYYVDGKSNITFKHNGIVSTNFYYNANTDKFSCNVVLQPGQNIFEITGVNDAGEDYESTIIIYEKEEEIKAPPIVTINNPPLCPYNTNTSTFPLRATVLEVDSKSQIKVYFNGVLMPSFNYDLESKILTAPLYLMEGMNSITITATNEVGSDSKSCQINYAVPPTIQPPIVDFINPSSDPHVSNSPKYTVRASVLNVDSKSFIRVKVNGYNISLFSYNASTKVVTFQADLNEGANMIEIKGWNEAGEDNENTTIFYHKPEVPRPPIVTFIDPDVDPIEVFEANYSVKAKVEYVDGASDIELKINGTKSTLFSYSASSKMMYFNTNLVEGSNVIQIKGTNKYGFDVETTTIIYKKEILKAPPIVNITNPAIDNKVFATPNIVVKANVFNVDNAANINVKFNGTVTTAFSYNLYTKQLSLPVILNPGLNVVEITGTNSAGSDYDKRLIIHEKPADPAPPTVDITNPPTSPFLATSGSFTFTANTTNIESKTQIVLTMNGDVIPGSSYTLTGTNQIIYNADLIPGNNIFQAVVTNADGSDDDLAIVVLKDEPCIIPTVGYISPVPYSTVDAADQKIDAQINNWSAGTVVELQLNGVSVGYMTYNSATSIATSNVTLNEGMNSIKVIVTNDCGTNQSTFTLNYEKPDAPCNVPILAIIGDDSFTTLEEKVTVSAGATNVENAGQISVKLNGSSVPFTFDTGTGTITIEASLAVGNNSILVTATTDCGSAVKTFNVKRDECKSPVIGAISPSPSTTTEETSVGVTATVSNVTKDEITLLVNGISQPFSFNEATGALNATVEIELGANEIEIKAVNACGRVEKKTDITRKNPCSEIVHNLINPAVTTVTSAEEKYNVVLNATGLSSAAQITVTYNGSAHPFTFDPVTGDINVGELTLVDGTHSLVVKMKNECSEKSVEYTISYKGCETPIITINGITEGQKFASPSMMMMVQILNANSADDITVKLNGAPIDFTFDPISKVLSAGLTFVEGSNSIEVIVDGCEKVSKAINVTYEIPCADITTGYMIPASPEQTVVDPSYAIQLSVNNVEAAAQISVKLNGSSIPFTYSAATNVVEISGITLVDGANTITVDATNACSSAKVTFTINYDGCKPPVITLGANPTDVSEPGYTFTATVTHIDDAADIIFLVDGAPHPFIFDAATGALTAELTLEEGTTNFKIEARGCETRESNAHVIYEIPCEPLVHALSIPASLVTSVADETYNIELVAQHVSADDISVTLNGSVVPFTLVGDVVKINGLALVDGDNTVVVNLKNDCSAETITYTIKHDKCNAPVIDLSANVVSASTESYTLNALIMNIDNAAQLKVTFNGAVVPFDFDAATHILTCTVTLNEGDNGFSIEARGCETTTDDLVVNFEDPCDPLTYSLASPASTAHTTEDDKITITLNTTGIEAKGDITVEINGMPIPFTFSGGVITIPDAALVDGVNKVIVTMKNPCSSETVTYDINYSPCKAPTITLTSSTATVSDPSYAFAATVLNVAAKADISVKLNGTDVPFDFDPATHAVTGTMTLIEGENDISISATGCVSSAATYKVTYDTPCDPIAYTIIMPAALTNAVDNPSFSANISTTNVASGHVSVTLNGSAIPFTFFAGKVMIKATLAEGVNTIIVSMDNGCSSETITFTYTYTPIVVPDPCDPLTYTLVAPDGMSINVDDEKFHFKLQTTNLTADDEIVIKLNEVVQAHTFNALTGMVEVSNMTLQDEDNFINIYLKNDCSVEDITPRIRYEMDYGDLDCDEDADGKVTICHFPPGEPDNPQTITIAKAALKTHIDHHNDYCGPCEAGCDEVTFDYLHPSSASGSTDEEAYEFRLSTSHVETKDDITVKLNGADVVFSFNPASGLIDADVTLTEGANTFVVTLKNDCSDKTVTCSVNYEPDYGHLDCDADADGKITICHFPPGQPDNPQTITIAKAALKPHVDHHDDYCGPCEDACDDITYQLIKPSNTSATVGTATIDVSLKLENVETAGIEVLLNGSAQLFTYNAASKTLSMKKVPLNSGMNTLKVTARNDCSNKVIVYSINSTKSGGGASDGGVTSVQPPVITNISPRGRTAQVTTPTYLFKCKVQNVKTKADIKMYVNGKAVTTFKYIGNSQHVSHNISLKEGPNSIKIVAKNNIKSVEATYSISYKKPGGGNVTSATVAPVITPLTPNKTTAVATKSTYLMKAKITNAKSKSNITVKHNGRSITNFSYNPSNSMFSVNLTLAPGRNTVVVTAKNGAKTATKTYTITLNASNQSAPAVAPVISMVSPAKTSATAATTSYTIKAKITNVKSKADITIKHNGRAMTRHSYSTGNKICTIPLTLAPGKNTIIVTAKNGAKTATKTYTITYSKPQQSTPGGGGGGAVSATPAAAPKITAITPRGATATTTTPSYTIKAKVENVKSKGEIKLTVNGKAMTNFTWNASTKEMVAKVALNAGNNTIKVVATSGGKSANKTYTIKYNKATGIQRN